MGTWSKDTSAALSLGFGVRKWEDLMRPIILALANYLLRRMAGLFNEKDGKGKGKRMGLKS